MDDTTKEIIALRTEVAELKEMVKALLDGTPKKECAIKDEIAKPVHTHDAKKNIDRYPEPQMIQETPGFLKTRLGRVTKYKPRYDPTPHQVEQPSKTPRNVPKYQFHPSQQRMFSSVPRRYPEKYNIADLWDEAASPIVSAPPKHDPNAPIYKPA